VGIGAIFNLTAIFLAIFLAFYTLNFPQKVAPVYCWVIYLMCMLATVFYSPSRGESMRLWLNYLSYFALFLIPFLIVKNQEDFVHWLKILGVSFVLPILCADLDLVRGGRYFEDAGNRIAGTFTHPNILAFYLVLAFTFFFYLLKSGHLKSSTPVKWGVRGLMLNTLVLLVATKTRNAWISIYTGFAIYAFLKDRKMLLLLMLIVPLLFLIPPVQERMLTVLKNDASGDYRGINSFEWRMQMWKSSFSKIAQRPLQGYGLGSFKSMSEEFSTNKKTGAHNTYVELIFETGMVGLLSFLGLFLSPLTVFFKKMRLSETLAEGQIWALVISYIISYMLICSADNLLFYLVFNWYVWFFIGLMMLASYRKYTVYA
jgi:O-antigen ligase